MYSTIAQTHTAAFVAGRRLVIWYFRAVKLHYRKGFRGTEQGAHIVEDIQAYCSLRYAH